MTRKNLILNVETPGEVTLWYPAHGSTDTAGVQAGDSVTKLREKSGVKRYIIFFSAGGRGRGGGAPGLRRGSPGRGPGAGSSVFGRVRGPDGAGGGGLGGR